MKMGMKRDYMIDLIQQNFKPGRDKKAQITLETKENNIGRHPAQELKQLEEKRKKEIETKLFQDYQVREKEKKKQEEAQRKKLENKRLMEDIARQN